MAGSSNQYTYQVGGTQIVVGASLATGVTIPALCNGWRLGYMSGGTLSFVQAATLQAAGPGYVLSTTETVECEGPGKFFLAAAGATAIAKVLFKFSATGLSGLP